MQELKQETVLEPPKPKKDELFGNWEPPQSKDKPRNGKKIVIAACALIALAAVGVAAWSVFSKPDAQPYTAVEVRRGTIAQTISATGKVQPVTTVQVGTQVSGTVAELFTDFNQTVKAGQIVAKLDPSQLEAQLTQAKAAQSSALASVQTAQMAVVTADANIEAAEANVARLDSVLKDAQRNVEVTKNLVEQEVAAKRTLETAEAALAQAAAQKQQGLAQTAQAKAQAQSARSQKDQAQAQALQAKAAVDVATVNLERTVIKAPIDGIVIARNVDVGQTVAASLQAPVLFLIANNLTNMQVLADVDEADVGRLTPGSKVKFTVDAFPQDTFEGRVSQVRLSPQMVQNVVTYTAVIDVSNPDGKLKPGMTANISVTVAENQNALLVPTGAFRFRPRQTGTAVWKVDGESLTPVRVRAGLSDGVNSEIISGDLHEGDKVAVASANQQAKGAPARKQQGSPFQPQRGGRR